MDKQLEIMYQSSTCIKYIKGELDKVYNMCINQSTIKRSNQLYEKALAQAKKEVFDNIKSVNKPYIVYQVNRYFYIGNGFAPKYF